MTTEERGFWESLTADDRRSWQPCKIRFETIQLKDLLPFPLHPQQCWQLFDQKSKKLAVQWQVSPKPPNSNADKFCLQVLSRLYLNWAYNELRRSL
jgi:hypothetical protein